jgi:dephospho-CoA kinase
MGGELEAIIHAAVFEALRRTVRDHADEGTIVVFDAALLMETGFDRACDFVVAVHAPVDERIDRVTRTRDMTPAEARARIMTQIPPDEQYERADLVIHNDADLATLEDQVDDLWAELQRTVAAE